MFGPVVMLLAVSPVCEPVFEPYKCHLVSFKFYQAGFPSRKQRARFNVISNKE